MMDFYKSPILVWSNVFWIIPAFIAFSSGSLLLAAPSMIVMLLSMYFHWRPSMLSEYIDTAFSFAYIALGPVLCTLSPDPRTAWVSGLAATVLAFLFWWSSHRFDRARNRAAYIWIHGCGWHPAAAGVTTMIYINYFGLL